MPGRDFDDDAELRPPGEATYVPDHELDSERDDEHRDTARTGYPDEPESTTDCRSCGASIPGGRTKCRFCLSNHIEPLDIDGADGDVDQSLLHVVHLLVPAASRYAAAAKGLTAGKFVPKHDRTITSCELIAELDEEPAQQLVNQWRAGTLPPAVQVTADVGQQLLATARERTPGMDIGEQRGDREAHATFLYDEAGHGIETDDRLTTLLEDDSDELWLLPALALHRTTSDEDVDDSAERRHQGPKRAGLTCRECDRETTHQFQTVEEIPDETWSGQPIWECRVCGTNRYGPAPDSVQ